MNTSTPTRICDFPYAAIDKGLLSVVAIGGFLLLVAFFSLIAIIYLIHQKKNNSRYLELQNEYEEHRKGDESGKKLNMAICILLLSLLVGCLCLGLGGYNLYWTRIYTKECPSTVILTAPRPLPAEVRNMPINMTVAFVGDTGASMNALRIYDLVKKNAEMLVHLGDFDYCDDPTLFQTQLKDILGPQFPIIAVIGNHDINKWKDYEQVLNGYYDGHGAGKNPNLACEGSLGVNYWCMYKGLFLAFSSVGTMCGGGYAKYNYHETQLEKNLNFSVDPSLGLLQKPWSICAWHKNQRLYQVGGKKNEVGYGVYDICKRMGAFVMTGHEHSFSRSHAIDVVDTQHVSQNCTSGSNCVYNLTNATIVTVSGLGGKSLRAVDTTLGALPHWASTYASDFGALFCKFNYNGNANLAYCYFLGIDGSQKDSFFVNRT